MLVLCNPHKYGLEKQGEQILANSAKTCKDEQNHVWSEEDEKIIDSIIDYMKPMPLFFEKTEGESGIEYTRKFIDKAINFLETLKERVQPQTHWKPSDEQINALYDVLNPCDGFDKELLESLYNDLKKLKEE